MSLIIVSFVVVFNILLLLILLYLVLHSDSYYSFQVQSTYLFKLLNFVVVYTKLATECFVYRCPLTAIYKFVLRLNQKYIYTYVLLTFIIPYIFFVYALMHYNNFIRYNGTIPILREHSCA